VLGGLCHCGRGRADGPSVELQVPGSWAGRGWNSCLSWSVEVAPNELILDKGIFGKEEDQQAYLIVDW